MHVTTDLEGGWLGEGVELARRILAYAALLEDRPTADAGRCSAELGCADDLRSIIRREWNPCDRPR